METVPEPNQPKKRQQRALGVRRAEAAVGEGRPVNQLSLKKSI